MFQFEKLMKVLFQKNEHFHEQFNFCIFLVEIPLKMYPTPTTYQEYGIKAKLMCLQFKVNCLESI